MAENVQDADTLEDDEPQLPVEPIPEEEQPRHRLTDKLHDVEFDREAYANMVIADYQAALNDREDWAVKLDEGYKRYLNETSPKTFPWENCANFHPPLTMTTIETLKPRLIEAVVGQDPMVLVRPVGVEDAERAENTEVFLNWQFKAEMDLFALVDDSAHLFLTAGIAQAKVRWKRTIRPIRAVRKFPPETTLETIFQHLFGRAVPKDFEHQKEFTWTGTLVLPGGRESEVKAEFAFFEDETQVLLDRDEVVFEAPKIEFPDPEDVIAPYRAGGDIQDLPWIMQRMFMSEDELRARARNKQFDRDAVEEVIRRGPSGADPLDDDAQEGARRTLDRAEGVDPMDADVQADQWCVLEDYRSYDIDDDGRPEEIVCWVAERSKMLLGWDYLDNVNASGKRPFEKEVFMPLPNRYYGISAPEMIRDIQDEMTAMHNQRVDFNTLANMPFYFYRGSSQHNPDLHKISPGVGIPIENPAADLAWPQFRTNPQFGQAEEALLQQALERLTGVTDMALGRQPNRVGATRTATGVASLLSESGLRFKVFMVRFQNFWRRIFQQVLALDQQYLPPGKEFRVTGRPEVIRILDRTEIAGRFDILLSATTETLNKQSLRETAQIKFSTLMNPALIQLGIVKPENLYELARDFLKSLDERDPSRFIGVPPTVAPKDPNYENAVFVSGGKVEPSLAENFDAHLMAHEQLKMLPVYQWMTPEAKQNLDQHIAATLQMKMAQQVAMQMAPAGRGATGPGGPQAKNAQIGRAEPQLPAQTVQPAGASAMNGGGPGGVYA